MAYYHESFFNRGIEYEIFRKVVLMNTKDFNLNYNNEIYKYEDVDKNNVLIDEGIAEAISLFNMKGYKTLNSCEGHLDLPFSLKNVDLKKIDDYIILSNPYISFDLSRLNYRYKEEIIGDFINKIPSIFYLMYDIDYYKLEKMKDYKEENKFEFIKNRSLDRTFNIYCRIDCDKDYNNFYKYKEEALKQFKKFAENLYATNSFPIILK